MINILNKVAMRGNVARRLLLLVGSLACFSFALAVQVPQPEGYYITIYSHTPTILWVAIGVALCLLPVAVAVKTSYFAHSWGLFAALVSLLIAMPWILGYYLYLSRDALIKVGAITSILQTGHLHPDNFYPGLHTMGAMASQIVGIRPAVITLPLLLGFAVATSFAGTLLASLFISSKRGKYIGGILAPILLISSTYTNFSPWSQSIPIFLFSLFALVRISGSSRLSHAVVVICFFFAITIYHPLGTIILLLIISVAMVIVGLLRLLSTRQVPINLQLVYSWILLAVIFSAWTGSFGAFVRPTIGSIVTNLVGAPSEVGGSYSPGNPSFIAQVRSPIQSASPRIGDLFKVGLFRYGFDGLVLLAAGIVALLGGNWQRVREMPQYYLLIVVPIPVFAGLGIVSMFLSLPIGFTRFILVATVLSAIVIAAESGRMLTTTPKKTTWRSARLITVVCVLFVVLMTPFSIYGSTHSKTANMQVTEMEVTGTGWFLDHKVDNSEVAARGMQVRRYSMLLAGYRGVTYDGDLPPHFGYDSEHPAWYSQRADNVYLIVTEKGRIAYPKLYPGYQDEWGFLPADFNRIQTDPNVTVAYTNGEMATYWATNSTQ